MTTVRSESDEVLSNTQAISNTQTTAEAAVMADRVAHAPPSLGPHPIRSFRWSWIGGVLLLSGLFLFVMDRIRDRTMRPNPTFSGAAQPLSSAPPVQVAQTREQLQTARFRRRRRLAQHRRADQAEGPRGKIVLLDFWTLCCINCIHTLPDLAKLEKKYPKELVVIGVHSPKFDNEKNDRKHPQGDPALRDQASRRQRRRHQDLGSLRRQLLADARPDRPRRQLRRRRSGEGNLRRCSTRTSPSSSRSTRTRRRSTRSRSTSSWPPRTGESPLFFPGKVLADAASKRLFIADSTHHRIVITDLDGKKIAVAGTGAAGQDGRRRSPRPFNDPQGMALDGDTLYVADRKNHLIRALDLKAKTVKTVAGTGEQGQRPARRRRRPSRPA